MKVEETADDTLITSLIDQVADLIEEYLNLSLVTTTITCLASARLSLVLPYGPVQSITSVKDPDDQDVDYVWNGFYLNFEPVTFSPTQPEAPPYTETTTIYETGYPDTKLPAGLLLGWMEVTAWLYENRGDERELQFMLQRNANLMPYRDKVWI